MVKPTVALVLGCGAARGYAHIGVIDAIEEQGYEIISIAGCSIGSIIGGAYASGKLPELRQWFSRLDKMDVIRLLDMSIWQGGNIKGDRFFHKIDELIGNPLIENLSIPFTAVAVDLTRQKEFWFQSGPLIEAMRASSAIPSVVSPVIISGRTYVDGGVLNPLPIIPTISATADLIIAVDLNGATAHIREAVIEEEVVDSMWFDVVKERLFGISRTSDPVEKMIDLPIKRKVEPEKWGRLQVINMMFETMQESLTQYKIAGYPPDILVSIPKDTCAFYDFWRADEVIKVGYDLAYQQLDKYNHRK